MTDYSNTRGELMFDIIMCSFILFIVILSIVQYLIHGNKYCKFIIDTELLYYNNYENKSEDSGLDLYIPEDIELKEGESMLIDLKIKLLCFDKNRYINVPFNIYPRSSTFKKFKVILTNSVGVIDKGYRGNIMINIVAFKDIKIKEGTRLMQATHPGLLPISSLKFTNINDNTLRGDGGFGSTGL